MKHQLLLFLICLCPALAHSQTITTPAINYSEDLATTVKKIEVTSTNTVVTFVNNLQSKGNWVQLNKSIYLQDSHGEERYAYLRSEGIPLRPEKFVADKDNQQLEFKVYFEKLKPGTKEINIIERARSLQEQQSDHTRFLNYFNVNLYKSGPAVTNVKISEVVLIPPPPLPNRVSSSSQTTYEMGDHATMMSSMYTNMLSTQLKIYSKPEITTQLAKITKNYYDALLKSGFSQDAALKIITSKQLISMDGKQ